MPLTFRTVSSKSVRDVIAEGRLPELEYGLLKKHGEKLRWTTADKALFLGMHIDILEAEQDQWKLEVQVRSLCHSKDVTSDYLKHEERFNMKRCVLVIGDVGILPAPWAGLIQPALYLHAHGCNVLFIEVPDFATNPPRWLKFGPAFLRATLRYLNVSSVHVLACGQGGSVFLEALGQGRAGFAATHFCYNIDCPPGSKKVPFPIFKLEEYLRDPGLQLWFGYTDEEGVYSRFDDGPSRRCYEAVTGMQARLEGERKRGRRSLDYDEVLISDNLGLVPKAPNVRRLAVGRNILLIFSDALLASVSRFFDHPPLQFQKDMAQGLVADLKLLGQLKPGEELPELPALRALRAPSKALAMEGQETLLLPPGTGSNSNPGSRRGTLERPTTSTPGTRLASLTGSTGSAAALSLDGVSERQRSMTGSTRSSSTPVLPQAVPDMDRGEVVAKVAPKSCRRPSNGLGPSEVYMREKVDMWTLLGPE